MVNDRKLRTTPSFRKRASSEYFKILGLGLVISFLACSSPLQEVKLYFTRGQESLRHYNSAQARIYFQKTKEAANAAIKSQPVAQLYVLKGLAEVQLEEWSAARRSFSLAYSLGFDKGEKWAAEVALFGLAQSLGELGLSQQAGQIYDYLVTRSQFEPVTLLAAQRYVDFTLERSFTLEEREKEVLLRRLLNRVRSLIKENYHQGFYHYLSSQILAHQQLYRRSFEEAVMARELGLPTEEIWRDNDRQIIFCFRQLKKDLLKEDWQDFLQLYQRLITSWGWADEETPPWMKR